MRGQFHGIASIGLVLVATVIAIVAMFRTSLALGVGYLVVCAVAPGVILYAYCAKCPCRTNCGHVFPGKLATTFTNRQPGPYTTVELVATGLALLLLLGLPQVWLWRYTWSFIAFWALNAIALVQIRAFVCRVCDNAYCPANPRGR
jgi:hypothetical protein